MLVDYSLLCRKHLYGKKSLDAIFTMAAMAYEGIFHR